MSKQYTSYSRVRDREATTTDDKDKAVGATYTTYIGRTKHEFVKNAQGFADDKSICISCGKTVGSLRKCQNKAPHQPTYEDNKPVTTFMNSDVWQTCWFGETEHIIHRKTGACIHCATTVAEFAECVPSSDAKLIAERYATAVQAYKSQQH